MRASYAHPCVIPVIETIQTDHKKRRTCSYIRTPLWKVPLIRNFLCELVGFADPNKARIIGIDGGCYLVSIEGYGFERPSVRVVEGAQPREESGMRHRCS